MWWFPGLFAMGFSFCGLLLMLASTLRMPTMSLSQQRRKRLMVRVFVGLLIIEFPMLCGAVIFVVLAETGFL
jgi:hypothetical protein